jgi:protein SCO1/2
VKRLWIGIPACLLFIAASLSGLDQAGAGDKKYQRTVERYTVPDVVLVNQDGKRVPLKGFLESDQPVVLDFIYGTCTTICPVLSASFAGLQNRLGPDAQKARLVSITIDPENDTPKVMKEYLKRYHAKPGWDFLTGTRGDIDRVMKAFNAYIPDKMYHHQLTLIRMSRDGAWVRIKELISGADLLEEYKKARTR